MDREERQWRKTCMLIDEKKALENRLRQAKKILCEYIKIYRKAPIDRTFDEERNLFKNVEKFLKDNKMSREELIMAVNPYILDPAIKTENLSTEQLEKTFTEIYGEGVV